MAPRWDTTYETGYGAVVLTGPTDGISELLQETEGFNLKVEATATGLIFQDVRDHQLQQLVSMAEAHQIYVSATHSPRKYLKRTRIKASRPLKLNLVEGKWYFSEYNEDNLPFVFIRRSYLERIGGTAIDEVQQYFDVDLYGGFESTPVKQSLASSDLAKYGLRPATVDDFHAHDLTPPINKELLDMRTGSVHTTPRVAALRNFGV